MSTNLFNPADKRSYPARWPLIRGKQLFQEMDERSKDGTEELLSVSHITGITPRSQKNVTMFQAESLVGYKLCKTGDIVANTMWTWQGAIGVSKFAGVVSPAYNVYRQKSDIFNPRYLDMLLRERQLVDVYHSLSTGIRPSRLRLYPDVFLTIKLPVPPREEQDQIVRFLDWKVSSINKMIAIKEKRRSLIFDLIQLYLFSDDASQFSIGRIENAFPKNWESTKAKHIFSERKEKGHAEEELLAVTQDKGVVFKKDCDNHYVQPSNLEDQKLVCPGDFIISLRSFQGGIEHSRIKGLVSAAYTVMELSPAYSHIEEYYGFLFKSKPFIQYLNSCVNDIRDGKKIDYKDFRDCFLPIPPISTLEKINALRKEYDNATEELNRYATLLRELRMCIISDTVTGKIDVRGIEIPEYEFVDIDIDNADENLKQGADEPPEEE